MALPENLRKGMLLRHKGDVYLVLDYYEAKTAQQKGVVHVKMRNVRTGHVTEVSADALGKIDEVHGEHRLMQYLYAQGKEHVFMDQKTYDQVAFHEDMIKNELPFLMPEREYRVLVLDEKPVMLELPSTINLKVIETAPPQRSVGSTSVYKEAKLETGLVVKVPLFIKNGDVLRISTATREYLGKES